MCACKVEKLDPRAIKCMFIEYLGGVKGYKFWDFKKSKCFIIRDAIFKEIEMFMGDTMELGENSKSTNIIYLEVELPFQRIKQDGDIHNASDTHEAIELKGEANHKDYVEHEEKIQIDLREVLSITLLQERKKRKLKLGWDM